ncbi:MAG TPA: DUF3667 domain-containing protein [Vicinamibacterales bacterium]|nr:DUF3667 domain-containing protein [Vicinamibacterales bacterium]
MRVVQPATLSECLNCGAVLTGAYCASCGQKEPHTDLTLREFLHEAAQELTQWEGKVPRTLKTLFVNPGLLTTDFLAGRRARWLPPLRVYLICSVAYFLSGPLIEAITGRAPREVASVTITSPDGSTTLTPEARREIEKGLPARLFGIERLERAAADQARLNRTIRTAYPKAMFALLPLFALLTRVGWRRTIPRYPAHLYFALHLHAAWFATLALSTFVTGFLPASAATVAIQAALAGYALWYGLAASRRVFHDPWGRTLAKAAAVAVVYSLCLLAVSVLMLAYALTTL